MLLWISFFLNLKPSCFFHFQPDIPLEEAREWCGGLAIGASKI